MKVRFADSVFDAAARTVRRGTATIQLPPKAFAFLTILVEHRGRALSTVELLQRVWPDVFVSEASLARVVRKIRAALGDATRDAEIVRTVHGYGYAFAATLLTDARHGSSADRVRPTCWLTGRSRTFALTEGEHLIGREPAVTVCLDSPKVSRRHARIVVHDGRATIEDLDSKNGTFVRGVRLPAPAVLEPGDTIRVGPYTLIFRVSHELTVTETESDRSLCR